MFWKNRKSKKTEQKEKQDRVADIFSVPGGYTSVTIPPAYSTTTITNYTVTDRSTTTNPNTFLVTGCTSPSSSTATDYRENVDLDSTLGQAHQSLENAESTLLHLRALRSMLDELTEEQLPDKERLKEPVDMLCDMFKDGVFDCFHSIVETLELCEDKIEGDGAKLFLEQIKETFKAYKERL